MQKIWQAIENWFASKGGVAHVIAAAWAFLILAYANDTQFHDFVLQVWAAVPAWGQEAITLAASLWALYKSWSPGAPQSNAALGKKLGLFLAIGFLVLGSAATRAQGITVSVGSEAVAARYQGNWSAGNHTTESLDVIDWGATQENSLSAEVHEFLLPGIGVNSYDVAAKYTPDLTAVLQKTNISPSLFQVFAQGGGGETTLPGATKGTWFAGGGASYRATANLTWSIVDGYALRFNGQTTYAVTAGLYYTVNPAASASAAVKQLIRRHAAAEAAAKTTQ